MPERINWYPGHMARSRRLLQEQLRAVDAVVELCDARAPLATRNPDLNQLTRGKARLLVLTLLMMLFSMIEGICFHETGMRAGHGNFTWAANSTAFLLWVVSMGILLRNLAQGGYRAASRLRRAGYWATLVLGLWHLASAVYYIWYIALDGHPF